MASTAFHLSFFGRFGYAVMAIFGTAFSVLLGLALTQYHVFPLWALAFLGLLFLAFAAIAAYSLSQLLRLTPRFVFTERGFTYRGLFSRFESSWSDVISYRLTYAGSAPFIFLEVLFSNSPSRLRNRLSLDVSGLRPDHQELIGLFQRHTSGTMKKSSPW